MSFQDRALKLYDVTQLSKLYESEFNKEDLHDRVLIFDVVASEASELNAENAVGKKAGNANEEVDNDAGKQSEDGSDGSVAKLKIVKLKFFRDY